MSKQHLLFETEARSWVEPLWQHMNPDKRKQIIDTLAKMALEKLQKSPRHQTKEHCDAS